MLIGARLLQGSFGALLIPQSIGLLIATFSREQLPAAFSIFGPVLGGSAVLGSLVAGFIYIRISGYKRLPERRAHESIQSDTASRHTVVV